MSARRPLIAVAAAVAALALPACSVPSTNFDAETNRAYDAGKGVNSRDTPVGIYNAVAVDNTPEDSAASTTATVSAALINRTDTAITLTGVTAQTADGQTLATDFAGGTGSIGLDPAQSAATERQVLSLGANDAEVVIELGDLAAGANVTLTFVFEEIDDIVLVDVPIVSRQDPIFASIVDPTTAESDEVAEDVATEEAVLEEQEAEDAAAAE